MPFWQEDQEREYNQTAVELLQEVSLSFPAVSEPPQTFSSPLSMFSSPSSVFPAVSQISSPILTIPADLSVSQGPSSSVSRPISAFSDNELQGMKNRFEALKIPIVSSSDVSTGFDFQPRDQSQFVNILGPQESFTEKMAISFN